MWVHVGERRYYYTYRWEHGRSRRLYAGTGEAAEKAAAEDACRRAARQAEAQAVRNYRADLHAADSLTHTLRRRTDALARAVLYLAGFHRHERSEWRRRRTD